MEYFLIICSSALALMVFLLMWRKSEKSAKASPFAKASEDKKGICKVATGRSAKKIQNKENILEFLKKKKKGSNEDFRKLLGVSNRTVATYLDELKKDNSVVQVGKTGKHTHYKLK